MNNPPAFDSAHTYRQKSIEWTLLQDNLGKPAPKRYTNWMLTKQKMVRWHWHQLDHMQIICVSLHTDNHTSTSSLNFYRSNNLPNAQPTALKHRRMLIYWFTNTSISLKMWTWLNKLLQFIHSLKQA